MTKPVVSTLFLIVLCAVVLPARNRTPWLQYVGSNLTNISQSAFHYNNGTQDSWWNIEHWLKATNVSNSTVQQEMHKDTGSNLTGFSESAAYQNNSAEPEVQQLNLEHLSNVTNLTLDQDVEKNETSDDEWLSYHSNWDESTKTPVNQNNDTGTSVHQWNQDKESKHATDSTVELDKEYTSAQSKLLILPSCFDYLNVSNQEGYFDLEPSPLLTILDDDGVPCLQVKLDVLIQVNMLRNKSIFKKWSAAFLPSPFKNDTTVSGACSNQDSSEAFAQVLWDQYALIWHFAKTFDKKSWYLSSLEFLTSRSDWFVQYDFPEVQCWRFLYFSNSMFESPLNTSYKSCRQTILNLESDIDSLNVFVFFLKDQFQAQAFMINGTVFDNVVC